MKKAKENKRFKNRWRLNQWNHDGRRIGTPKNTRGIGTPKTAIRIRGERNRRGWNTRLSKQPCGLFWRINRLLCAQQSICSYSTVALHTHLKIRLYRTRDEPPLYKTLESWTRLQCLYGALVLIGIPGDRGTCNADTNLIEETSKNAHRVWCELWNSQATYRRYLNKHAPYVPKLLNRWEITVNVDVERSNFNIRPIMTEIHQNFPAAANCTPAHYMKYAFIGSGTVH